jgi:hypothetical protein
VDKHCRHGSLFWGVCGQTFPTWKPFLGVSVDKHSRHGGLFWGVCGQTFPTWKPFGGVCVDKHSRHRKPLGGSVDKHSRHGGLFLGGPWANIPDMGAFSGGSVGKHSRRRLLLQVGAQRNPFEQSYQTWRHTCTQMMMQLTHVRTVCTVAWSVQEEGTLLVGIRGLSV